VTIRARYFDGRTSAGHDVEVALYGDGRLTVTGAGIAREVALRQIQVSERVGDTMRRFTFADGAVCEIPDNETVDQWLTQLGAHSAEHGVFRLERNWRYALYALAATALLTWAFIRWGIPSAANHAAHVLPRSVDTAIGQGGLEALDRVFFEPTQLSMPQQTQLRAQIERMQEQMNTGLPLRLELRAGGVIGPNAFALPSGIIVVTDELVEIAEHPEEIESVLAHEIGHIVHRHSLRMVLQGSASALLMFTVLGDVSSLSTLAASIPTVLVQARHSRDFEREADAYAVAWLKQEGIATHYFNDLLQRMEKYQADEGHPQDGEVMSYFSSHPRTDERGRE
jgi:Zn-dependent protease with chaperone function